MPSYARLVAPEHVIDNATALEAASIDESSLSPVMPAAIVRVFTSDEIQRVVRYCHQHKVPLTVRAPEALLKAPLSRVQMESCLMFPEWTR